MERKDGKAVKPERIKYVFLKKALLCLVVALMLGGCSALVVFIPEAVGAAITCKNRDDNCRPEVEQEESITKKDCHIDQIVRCERVEDPPGA